MPKRESYKGDEANRAGCDREGSVPVPRSGKSTGKMRSLWTILGLSLGFSALLRAQSLQLAGGIDVRYTAESPSASDFRLQGLFLNVRKVWSDDLGDRWIGVAQADFDNNFERVRPYQVYLQYKGPLGKWNIRAGHYLLPFGLLANYDTERLLLQGLERISLGIRKDSGVQLLGRFGSWDYAASVTSGLGDVKFIDSRANPVVTARLAHVQGGLQVGFSTLIGSVLIDPEFGLGRSRLRERKFAIDATKSFGPLTVRAEGVGGTDDRQAVGGGIVLGDYALTPKLEVNTRYAGWSRDGVQHSTELGFTYLIRTGLYARAAGSFEFGKERNNGFTIQLYYEFSRQF